MSCSPLRTTPLRETLKRPRALSSDPPPAWTAADATDRLFVLYAADRSRDPAPWASEDVFGTERADRRRMSLTWSEVRVGRCERRRAAAPETTAADCEVPLPLK